MSAAGRPGRSVVHRPATASQGQPSKTSHWRNRRPPGLVVASVVRSSTSCSLLLFAHQLHAPSGRGRTLIDPQNARYQTPVSPSIDPCWFQSSLSLCTYVASWRRLASIQRIRVRTRGLFAWSFLCFYISPAGHSPAGLPRRKIMHGDEPPVHA